MNQSVSAWKCPILAGSIFQGSNIHIEPIRELTSEEVVKLDQYTETATNARNRFKLFAILRRNYEQWLGYTRSLLQPGDNLDRDELLELDRLLLNFLSAAKSTLDHFRQDWIQTYRGTDREGGLQERLGKLESTSWAFAFFQDLRNFTQHCGLPVGHYSRSTSASSVNLHIHADSNWLTKHYKNWEKSKLTKDRGMLDLIDLTREYHVYLERDFGSFVAQVFAPELIEAHRFLEDLSAEVLSKHPTARMEVIMSISVNGNKSNFQFKTPPSDLFAWLGIEVKTKQA